MIWQLKTLFYYLACVVKHMTADIFECVAFQSGHFFDKKKSCRKRSLWCHVIVAIFKRNVFTGIICIAAVLNNIWTSGTDENHEACWVWATPVISTVHSGNWHTGEPNNKNNKEHCLTMGRYRSLRYIDLPCNNAQQFLCKLFSQNSNVVQPSLNKVYNTSLCWNL